MDKRTELGTFLRSRRARLQPRDAGLQAYGERRRVPGLRREELAQLAGVSVDYYVRFEQGRADGVSDAVIDAVAAALRLDDAETAHLHRLVRALGVTNSAAPPPQQVRTGLHRLLESIADVPAYVIGRRTDILAWNPLFAALLAVDLAALAPSHRNKARLVFLHSEVRDRFVNWEMKARDVVAYLRMDLGRHPEDPTFPALIAELSGASPDFRRLWDEQEVRDKTHGDYLLQHPLTGEFTLSYESLKLPGDPDQTLITYTAEPGTPAQRALRVLAGGAHRTRGTAITAA